jgi:hypothetical protein
MHETRRGSGSHASAAATDQLTNGITETRAEVVSLGESAGVGSDRGSRHMARSTANRSLASAEAVTEMSKRSREGGILTGGD